VTTPPSRIRLLPPELAEQIAAGEVVERPGSVVKELVENALDAGARKVEVTLEAGGRRLIRVVDDGCGMTPEEARLSLQRHATSKLQASDDLWRLDTFGFRGEALPSIASVSRFALSTKLAGGDDPAGFRLELEGGREVLARAHGMPDGTQIEVRDLFFNVPARLKFLKTEATEAGNVAESLLRLSLANPRVHFRLRSNDRMVLDLPPVDSPAERVRAALGRRGAGALHEALGEENGVRVHAFVAGPEEASTTPRNTFLFVGRRTVRDRSLVSALGMAYGELLEKGRYPLAALFLELAGGDVDVNVHPQKLEVRFAHAQEVYAAVRHVVGAAIARAPWLAAARPRPFSLPPSPRPNDGPEPSEEFAPPDTRAAWSMDAAARAAVRGAGDGTDDALAFARPRGGASAGGGAVGAVSGAGVRTGAARPWPAAPSPPPLPWPQPIDSPVPGAVPTAYFERLIYIGQAHRTYFVCEAPGELVLIDQHAAHERLAFQRLRQAYTARAVTRQRLLFPLEIEVDELLRATAQEPAAAAALERLGFEVEVVGERLVLRAVPELLKDAPGEVLLKDALAGLVEGAPEDDAGAVDRAAAARDHWLATLACHSVRRAGDVMSREEAVALLAALDDVDLRSHCPHGRPVLVRLTLTELERRFGRA
jgi:DNA mismatch repair protein MutL